MKGVILCGGLATRLYPLTLTCNKHLLPIYNKPMCFYPIQTLVQAGITEVLIIVSGPHAGDFLPVLQNGKELGLTHLEYAYQSKPNGGIADALSLAESFANNNPIAVILGDNTTDANISEDVKNFKLAINERTKSEDLLAKIFLKKVNDSSRFGVPEFNSEGKIIDIVEKPKNPKSLFAVTGLYLYDNNVFNLIKKCSPSKRNELEITDVNNLYIKHGTLEASYLNGFWQDAGTFENLYLANKYWAEKEIKNVEINEPPNL